MQVCTSLQTDNHANTPPLSYLNAYALPATQPTASKHWRHFLPIGTFYIYEATKPGFSLLCLLEDESRLQHLKPLVSESNLNPWTVTRREMSGEGKCSETSCSTFCVHRTSYHDAWTPYLHDPGLECQFLLLLLHCWAIIISVAFTFTVLTVQLDT